MATMFGRFEIQSELSRSETALVYKATDTETNQTVALKTQSLEPLGERAQAFVDTLIAEGESTRDLASQNIALLYGAGEIDGQFCAAMEYIQGNSIATMLSRKEGFSIWDLVDITRQVCAGLDSAAAKGVVHYSLEPAKIMVQWDGMVKMLGYGISYMSLIEAGADGGLGRLLPYCSPEQARGEAIDLRSNLFTWGAILYEMVTGRKAFDATDPAVLVNQIQNEIPPAPSSLNPKVHAGVSTLIMKALAQDAEARYQTARELVDDLEKCKDGGRKSAADPKKAAPAAKAAVSPAARTAAANKFVTASSQSAQPESPASAATPDPEIQTFSQAHTPVTEKKSWAAAAGMASASVGHSSGSDSGARFIEEPAHNSGAQLSAAAFETETEASAPRIAVDPVMAGTVETSSGQSFSDIAELPPLKEVSYAPPPPPVYEGSEPAVVQIYPKKEEKPRIQPREVAEKAIKEIKTVPPRLMLYSISAAVGLILIVVVALFFHVRSEDDGSTAAPRPTKAATSQVQPASPAPTAPAPQQAAVVPAPVPEPEPEVIVRQVGKRAARRATPAPVPVVIPGQVQIDSNPQGAQIQLDGKSDPSWVTPFNLTGLSPGKHLISASKAGYSAEIRSVDVASGSKSFVVIHLAPSNALMLVNSTPTGAEVVLDGKNTGRVTPAQFAVERGSHTVVLRKAGYLEETTTADLGPGQNFQYGPALRALGNADDIRTVGKFKKMFGKGGDSAAGMGSVSIRTQPKGAQIAINQRLLDKQSPVEVMLGPGNYVLDISVTGFKPLHKIINVEKGGKVAVDEILERE
ncbi:MAG: PEGA domain-containing protein [Acidobacteriia bacterium]|nr:PEGA domain-containing protein [Terriglobia bacterium]